LSRIFVTEFRYNALVRLFSKLAISTARTVSWSSMPMVV